MGEVRVVDRGSKEIVVFLSGEVGRGMEAELGDALAEVALLERLDDLDRVVVDAGAVTAFDETGLNFLRDLHRNGRRQGYDLELAMLTDPVRTALDRAEWPPSTRTH